MKTSYQRLIAVGLNPVLQKTLIFERLNVGAVNRAKVQLTTVGGKSMHFAIAGNTVATGSTTVAYFRGGTPGEYIQRIVEDHRLPHIAVEIPGNTRICTTLLCEATGDMTELIEPSPEIDVANYQTMQARVNEVLPDMDGIALCGTWPPGVGSEFYAGIAAAKGNAVLLLDGYRDVEPTLETGNVDILKINVDELKDLFGGDTVSEAAERCFAKYAVQHLAITDGPGDAYLWSGGQAWRYSLPAQTGLLNPIGAGDTVAAVLLVRLLQGKAIEEAFADGLAAATASCRHLTGATFEVAEIAELRGKIEVTKNGDKT
jgi:tagatose 6-phosphate kinase